MNEHLVLGQVALGYSPMVDRQRTVIATRLTVFPDNPDARPDPAELLAALLEVWPAPAEGEAGAAPKVLLNPAGEALLLGMLQARPPAHLMIEVPAFLAGDARHAGDLTALHASGSVLLIKGRPLQPLPAELMACFRHSIVDAGEERGGAGARDLSTVQSGVRTLAGLEQAFAGGAIATLGWPIDDQPAPSGGRKAVPQDLQVALELMNGVDREAPVQQLEATLRKDPTLAFRLMRYLNSPGFGLAVEITSFGHALMMLGHQRLKRWLALLLASSSKDANAKALMFCAVRRGLLMEELGRNLPDAELRGEIFICGVFSLLDRLLKQPFAELLKNVPVPDSVRAALVDEAGPFHPYLELVRAIENESRLDIQEWRDQLFMTPLEVNRALLKALAAARALD